MGRRHQLFIIARIPHRDSKTPRYRCITAIHSQCLYGCDALAVCNAFLKLVRAKDNADVVKAELAALASQYNADQDLPAFPSPFLTWLLAMTFASNIKEEYSSFVHILNPNMGSHGGDNNDGITVFDLTDPSSPAYCFVSLGEIEAHLQVKANVPLSGETYVRAYNPDSSVDLESDSEMGEEEMQELRAEEPNVQQAINGLKGEKLVQLWMLAEAWPGEREGYEKSLAEATSETNGLSQETRVTSDPDISPPQPLVPSLSEISLRKALAHAEESDNIAGLDIVASLPGLGETASLNVLAELDHFSTATFSILLNALSNNTECDPEHLDISRYALTAEQVTAVVTHFPATKVLNLTGNRQIDGNVVLSLLPSLPNLSRLIVYDCPGMSLADIDRIRSAASRLYAVYHRALMVRSLELRRFNMGNDQRFRASSRAVGPATGAYAPLFTFVMKDTTPFFHTGEKVIGVSIPWLSARAIVIALCDLHDHFQWASSFDLYGRPAEVFFSNLPRAPHVPFKERGIGNIPDKAALSANEGWVYVLKATSPIMFSIHIGDTTFEWGFVRYRFASSSSSHGAGSEKPALDEVEVMGLDRWLKEVDPNQEVEKEWAEKLEGKLSRSDKMTMITQEQAWELLSNDIPLTTAGDRS